MTTVENPTRPTGSDTPAESIRHPLDRLRRAIRTYVGIESLALLVLFLSGCFWLGLAFDYGLFKAFGVDWVQELPVWLRQAVRIVVVALLFYLLARSIMALVRRFRNNALALVLEQRFPEQLGDRLITAVELADPAGAERYGYSRPMLEQTLREAAERVDQLPLKQVFDWRRLWYRVAFALLASAGVFVAVAGGYCAINKMSLGEYLLRFQNIAAIWYERNILLWNTIWPRQAHLEVVDFPESGELRIGRDAPPPALRVRATHWLVADHRAFEGWRPLIWHDVRPSLLGSEVAIPAIPATWQTWTMDRIEIALDHQDPALSADAHLGLRNVIARLEELAEQPQMARRLRKLKVPAEITVYYRGDTVRSEQTFQRHNEQEYTGVLSDLKESVRFTARGRDYSTPYQTITIVPPPSLSKLTRDEEQPAYLYYRFLGNEKSEGLRGKKQLFRDITVSLSGGTSRIDVPLGTTVILKGESDKPLTPPTGSKLAPGPGVRVHAREGSGPLKPVITQLGEKDFSVRFDNIATPLDFDLQLVDTDNVTGMRHVVIKPTDDAPPDVDVIVEVLRKTSQGYLASPAAKVPISGKVRDDHGLARVEYRYHLSSLDLQAAAVGPVASLVQFTPRGGLDLLAPAYLSYVVALTRSLSDESTRPPTLVPLTAFARRLRETEADAVSLADLDKRLSTVPEHKMLRELTLDPDDEFLDLLPLGLKVSDDSQVQPHYRLRLEIAAVDGNVETGPGTGTNKEKFTIQLVSENELLSEIAKEEESLHVKLEDALNKLKEGRTKLEQVLQELPTLKGDEFSPMTRRAEELEETVVRTWDITQEVYKDYRRILKELNVNRVQAKIITKVDQSICQPLESVLNQEFVRTDEAFKEFHKLLEDKKADPAAGAKSRQELDRLIDKLARVLDAMGDLMTINKLIEQLTVLIKGQQGVTDRFKELNEKLQQDLFDSVFDKPKPEKPKQ
ncbi:MAG TPA: hypothetical protein VGP68_23950 [Gemmataceae bacterium]|nr:hypothetical protein [Gemmataceae bacterium]